MKKFYFNKSVIFLGFTFIFLVSDSLAIINFELVKSSIRKRRYIYYTACAAAGSVIVGLLGYKVYSKFYAPQFERSDGDEQQEKKDTGKNGLTTPGEQKLKIPKKSRARKVSGESKDKQKQVTDNTTEAGERNKYLLKVLRKVSIPKGRRRLPRKRN